MLTDTVKYKNFFDQEKTKTLHFHIGVAKFLDNFDLERQIREVQAITEAEKHELDDDEKRLILEVVKRIIRMGYGVRSDDGDRFDQSEAVWLAFRESAAYDRFLLDLFVDTNKANDFIKNVMTTDLRTTAIAQASPEQLQTLDGTKPPEDTRPEWLREGRAPSPAEFAAATDEQKLAGYNLRTQA